MAITAAVSIAVAAVTWSITQRAESAFPQPGFNGDMVASAESTFGVSDDVASIIESATVDALSDGPERIGAEVRVGSNPTRVAATEEAVWVANNADGTVSRVDRAVEEVVATIAVGEAPIGIAAGEGSVWVSDQFDGTVRRIDPSTDEVIAVITTGHRVQADLAVGAGSVWVAGLQDGVVARIDPATNEVVASIPVGDHPYSVAASDDDVWVGDFIEGALRQVDPIRNEAAAPIQLDGDEVWDIALADDGTVWATSGIVTGTLSRVEPDAGVVAATVDVASFPYGVTIENDDVWVANYGLSGTLARIDAVSGTVASSLTISDDVLIGIDPIGVVGLDGDLWVTNRNGTLTRVSV